MATPKAYKPMDYAEALAFLSRHSTVDSSEFSVAEVHIYAEILATHKRIDEIENQAQEMMSPDAMMEMAQKFLGGGLM